MNTPESLQPFLDAAYQCAMQMLQNAAYIKKEAPTVAWSEGMLEKVQAVCASLIGTKHDVITELAELAETPLAPDELNQRVERIKNWLGEPIPELHDLVTSLRATAETNRVYSLGVMLIGESAVNILNAHSACLDAAADCLQEADEPMSQETEKFYNPELVAPAVASLSLSRLKKLVDEWTFGEWLGEMICSSSSPDSVAPDSQEASELAMLAGDSEMEVSRLLENLTEDQIQSMISQAGCACGDDVQEEMEQISPC